jgi:hypothetical protein
MEKIVSGFRCHLKRSFIILFFADASIKTKSEITIKSSNKFKCTRSKLIASSSNRLFLPILAIAFGFF